MYGPKPRPCHRTAAPFPEMCKPKISTHGDLYGRGTSGRGHQRTSSFFSRRKWSFYPGVYTVSSCTTPTPSNASSGQLTSSTASSYTLTVRRKHTQKNPISCANMQTQPHCSANLDKSPPFRKMGVSLQSFFWLPHWPLPSKWRKTITLYPDCKEQALMIQKNLTFLLTQRPLCSRRNLLTTDFTLFLFPFRTLQ